MESLGSYLRRKRDEHARSLEDVARETRIQLALLRALESDDLDALPHPTFVRGFLKNICRALGISDGRALELYDEARHPGGLAAAGPAHAQPERVVPGGTVERRRPRAPASLIAAGLVLVIALLFFTIRITGGPLPEDQAPEVTRARAVPTAPTAPVSRAAAR